MVRFYANLTNSSTAILNGAKRMVWMGYNMGVRSSRMSFVLPDKARIDGESSRLRSQRAGRVETGANG